MCKVSIIVPVYNAEKCIERCIESVIHQDYQDWQLVLVNDGSKDRTKEILDSFAATDERITVLHKPNSGVSSTRNKGLQLAKGEYIQFMDADDWLPTESCKLLIREMEENDVDMVIGDFYRVVDDNVAKKGSIAKAGVISRKEYSDNMLLTPADFYYGVLWNKLYKKSIIDQYHLEMDGNISFCEDMIFNLEYLLHVNNIAVLKAPIYYYVKTEGSLVEKGMNIPSIINMKRNVITYYNSFFKNTMDSSDYLTRMPIIYGYYIAISTDGFALPFMKSYKLGQEKGQPVYINNQMYSSLMMNNYLSGSLVDYYLNTVAQQYDLETNDVKVLYCLYLADHSLTFDQIQAYTAVSNVVLVVSLAKLFALGHIKRDREEGFGYFSLASEGIRNTLKDVQQDCDNIRYKGLSKEEIQQYENLQTAVTMNIENYLKK